MAASFRTWVRRTRCPDATQPRVTVRPKPPVLLGATSTMSRWHRAGVVSDNPRPSRPRRLQGSHRDAPRTISVRNFVPTPVTPPLRGSLPALDLALQRSLGFPPFRLAASLRASLASTLRWSLEVRWALVSELKTGCASRYAGSMGIREIQTFSPHFSVSSPRGAVAVPSSSPWREWHGTIRRALATGIAAIVATVARTLTGVFAFWTRTRAQGAATPAAVVRFSRPRPSRDPARPSADGRATPRGH